MSVRRLLTVRNLYKSVQIQEQSCHLLGNSRSYSNALVNGPITHCWSLSSLYASSHAMNLTHGRTNALPSTMAAPPFMYLSNARLLSTEAAKVPPQAQMRSTRLTVLSPGIIHEPYAPCEKIPFFKRWFTKIGWQKTKADIIVELKNAYAIAKLRKTGYKVKTFYNEAFDLYKQINFMLANGDKNSLRKKVTERMFSTLKNEIKQRDSRWTAVYWEVIEPAISIRTLRARLIAVDPKDLSKVFIQLTLEFLTKQKFEAYDSKGAVVAGNKNQEIVVREFWVFEKSLFQKGAFWRLCGRIPVQTNPPTKPA